MNASMLSHQLSLKFLLASIIQAEEFKAVFKDHLRYSLRRHGVVTPFQKKCAFNSLEFNSISLTLRYKEQNYNITTLMDIWKPNLKL